MKIFILSGKMIFKAKNIDDAFDKVARHFRSLWRGYEGIEILPETDIKIEEYKKEE